MSEYSTFEEYKKTLRQVQIVQLNMLKEVKRICEKHNIKYFLSSGTLLGAVRHKGFIPWDDDLDVGMTWENYARFRKVVDTELTDKYYFLEWHNYEDYGFPYAKVKCRDTIYIENKDKKTQHNEIFIDIFTYNVYCPTRKAKFTQGYPLDFLRTIAKLKAKNQPWAGDGKLKYLKYQPLVLISKLIKQKTIVNLYEKIAQKNNHSDMPEYYSHGLNRYGKWVVERKWIDELVELPFEDDFFLCPLEYDLCLNKIYGDYMKLPKESDRWDRHGIIKVSLGNINPEH